MRTFFVLLLLIGAPAAAQQRPYVDPMLRALLDPAVLSAAMGAPDLPEDVPLPLGDLLALERGASGEMEVGVLLEASGNDGRRAVQAAGGRVGTVVGDFLTARVPLRNLGALASDARVRRIEASRRLETSNDEGVAAVRADRLRRRGADEAFRGSTGAGVLIGIYDTGIDFLHGDFVDETGRPRVAALWDQTAGLGPPPAGFDYGRLCEPSSLASGSCPQQDFHGHGTHVAGTAAGDGSSAGPGAAPFLYAGMAPGADLLVVKGGEGSFDSGRVVDGVWWIFEEATRLGRPVVVNLSLSGQSGPRDGSTVFERALDQLSGPGRILVAAAGNAGSNRNTSPPLAPANIHGSAVPAVGQVREFAFEVGLYTPRPGACNDLIAISLWHAPEDRLAVSLVRPDGSTANALPGSVGEQDSPQGWIRIDNGSGGPDPGNGDLEVHIQAGDCGPLGSAPATGRWVLRVEPSQASSGRPYHLWKHLSTMGSPGAEGFDNLYVVGTPGTARRAITAGAFVTRLCWPNQVGSSCSSPGEDPGDIAFFSPAGPTRDGRGKPEITAPGRMVLSARAQLSFTSEEFLAPGGSHAAAQGTSMAAPHVTGAIAILLQFAPELEPEAALAILAGSASRDGFTNRTYGPGAPASWWWGAGKLDASAALESIIDPETTIAQVILSGVREETSIDTLIVGEERRLSAEVYDALGRSSTVAVGWSTSSEAVLQVDGDGLVVARGGGSATVTASAGGRGAAREFHVMVPSTFVFAAEPLPAGDAQRSLRDATLPLLRMRAHTDGFEAVQVLSLTVDVAGIDAGATVLLVEDSDRDGTIFGFEPVHASVPVVLDGSGVRRVTLEPEDLFVQAGDPVDLLVGVRLSGAVPHASDFSATLIPGTLRTRGAISGALDRHDSPLSAIASGAVGTTVLTADETLALSENPVRSARLILNFSQRPDFAAVYALDGRRVADLLPRLEGGLRLAWDLTNDRGAVIAPGIYLVVFRIAGRTMQERLIVAERRAGSS